MIKYDKLTAINTNMVFKSHFSSSVEYFLLVEEKKKEQLGPKISWEV